LSGVIASRWNLRGERNSHLINIIRLLIVSLLIVFPPF
jgi:hypothetical protein